MSDPLQAFHSAHQARLAEIAGQPVPLGYGDFPGEVQAILAGVGVLVMEAGGVLLVRGRDAAAFVNGLTTNDLKGLVPGEAQHNLVCANKGKILHHVQVFALDGEQVVVVAEPGDLEAVAGHFRAFHIREELEIGRVEMARVDLLGPAAPAALEAVVPSAGRPKTTFAGAPLLVARAPLGALAGFLALLPPGSAPALVEALQRQEPNARLVGMEAFDEARIRQGIPRFGPDYGEDHLPAETGLYDHISFTKGCYVGQEIHARMHYRGHPNRQLAALAIPETTAEGLAVGSEVFHEGQAVGPVTSLARLSAEGTRRAIAMLRYPVVREAPPLAAGPAQGADIAILPLATALGAPRR